MIAKIKDNKKLQMIIVQFILLILSIGFACGTICINRMGSQDSVFNFNRLYELSKFIKYGEFPSFNINTAVPYGSAITTFYPWVTLLLFVPIVYLFHNALICWSVLIFLMMLLGYEIAFFASNKLFKSYLKSTLFAIIYCLSTFTINNIITGCDIGSFLGTFFAPIVIVGWIFWLKDNKWKMMTVGLILMAFTHILTAVITFFSLILLTVFCINLIKNKSKHIITYLKSITILIISTCIIWLPMLILLRHNAIKSPEASIYNENIAAPVIPNSLSFLIAPYLFKVWTFSDLVCLVLVIIYWKTLSKLSKRFIYFSVFYIILNIKWIKTLLILHTPLRQIQFMYRICFISHLLLSIVLVSIIVNIIMKKWYIQNVISLLGVLLALNIGSVYVSYACVNIPKAKPIHIFTQKLNNSHKISKKQNNYIKNDWITYRLNSYLFSSKIIRHGDFYDDYNPVNEVINEDYLPNGFFENNKDYIVRPKDNGVIKFYMGHNCKKLLMPMTMYNGQEYHLKLDDKYISSNKSFNKKMGLVELHNVHKGWHKIQLIIPTMNYRYFALATSIIGLGILIFLPDKRRRKENDKE